MKLLLVALDSSPRAQKVLDTALQLAQKTGAKLRLVRAVGLPPEVPMTPFGVTPDGFIEILLEQARKGLEEYAAKVPPALLEGTDTRVGTPWSGICDAAKDSHADLIIVGSHGYHGLDRIIGTTAAKVVNHAECSVLVARNLEI
ncbi:MAG TPA: universal stress protein [Polyangiaceae bacterium]|jgi:nucleotide-binding universal stress UspA family protein|nr:universal stress protein [Polyangiaceae bacterium]